MTTHNKQVGGEAAEGGSSGSRERNTSKEGASRGSKGGSRNELHPPSLPACIGARDIMETFLLALMSA
eukprot:1549879-Pyramimonas_sp.AAC.1